MTRKSDTYEDEYEALNMMISSSGLEFKEVANFLFPDRKPESAYSRLKACLNQDRDERLTFGQIVRAMKFCKRFDPLLYMCDETLHVRPERKSAEDEQIKLIETISNTAEILQKAMAQLERLQK